MSETGFYTVLIFGLQAAACAVWFAVGFLWAKKWNQKNQGEGK